MIRVLTIVSLFTVSIHMGNVSPLVQFCCFFLISAARHDFICCLFPLLYPKSIKSKCMLRKTCQLAHHCAPQYIHMCICNLPYNFISFPQIYFLFLLVFHFEIKYYRNFPDIMIFFTLS